MAKSSDVQNAKLAQLHKRKGGSLWRLTDTDTTFVAVRKGDTVEVHQPGLSTLNIEAKQFEKMKQFDVIERIFILGNGTHITSLPGSQEEVSA